MFAAQVRRAPSAVAVADGELRLSYAELDAASASIAAALVQRGVRAGQPVAVCLPRSWQLVVLMLGVLRAGAVLVPVDAGSPADRIDTILADCGCAAFIHAKVRPGVTLPAGAWSESIDALLARGASAPPATQVPREAGGFCMLFYTSGTTGQPKGVEVRAEGVLRLCKPGYIDIRPGDRYASLSNPAFDAISFEVWVPLLTGGCCVVFHEEDLQDARRFAARLVAQRIDTLFITVALFNAVVDQEPHCFTGTRQVLVGGEQLNAEAVKSWYRANPDAAGQLWNVYGPTECTTFALAHRIPREFDGTLVPIGSPLADTEVQLVAEGTRTAKDGEVAELHLGGAGVAVGYHHLPELTAERFVRLPWLDGGQAVYYRTGDLVRRNVAGLIEYVGRTDRQVKVRGFRIEPGEVEQRILRHPAVRRAHVCTRRDAAGHHELLAFLVTAPELDFDTFDAHLRATLPHYMRPHRLFRVDAFPLTPNGKLDEPRMLAEAPEPWRRAAGESAQADPWQRQVLDLAQQVLAHPALRPEDDFIGSGGDSLKALQFHFAALRQWRHDLPVAAILREPFAALAERLAQSANDAASIYPPAPPRTDADRAPATAEQQRLWFIQQQAPSSTAYNVPLAFRLDGPIDGNALARALGLLVQRHPALHTAFIAGADSLQQVVMQRAHEACHCHPPGRFDESNWRAFADLVFGAPFDLSAPQLFQAHWLPLAAERGVLLLHIHHAVVDGWSLNLLFQDLGALYAVCVSGGPVPDALPALTPLEFAPWQSAWFQQPEYARRRAAVADLHRAQGGASPPLEPRRPEAGIEARLHLVPLDFACRAGLDQLCAQSRLTRFEVLLSVFAWAIHAATGRDRVRIASPVANRPIAEFETAVGMFANTVLVPMAVDELDDLHAQLRQQAATVQAALACQDVALADVVADLQLAARPAGSLFDFMFVLENTDYGRFRLPGAHATLCLADRVQGKCPLTLSVVDGESGLDCIWEYQCSHFDAGEIEAMAGLFRRGLDLLLQESPASLDDLVVPYRQRLPQLGSGPAAPIGFTSIADWFEHQARSTPQAPALRARDRTFSYRELDGLADALAMDLLEAHPVAATAADQPVHVALYLDASVEHIVALLALAKLNLTALPLDTGYPPALLRQILEQAQPHCVLLRADALEALDSLDDGRFPRHVVTLETRTDAASPPMQRGLRPLYTLFTSGSTGTPKGVRVMDRALCNLLQWQRTHGGLAPAAATLQFSMLSFDVSFQEIFGTLCGGGCYHLLPPAWRQDPEALLGYLRDARIERIFMPYVALQFVAETAVARGLHPADLRDVVTAGEQLLCTEPIRRWFAGMPRATLHNHYGPTETHVVSACRLTGPAERWPARPPIGTAVSNALLRVVDARDRPLPPGCSGQLLIGGPMAWRCYLNDAQLNAARFTDLDGGTFYRTGDRASFGHDGQLHFLGRDDQQIKLSGHRLELGQIETVLMRHPSVVTAIVAGEGEPAGLVAYLQADGSEPSAESLDRHLAQHLPGHVRIDHYRQLARWPRTPSGKIDRRALPQAEWRALTPPQATSATRLASAMEQSLAEAFAAVVGRPIAADQTFFEAGATSLDLIRFQLRCRSALGLQVSMPDLFEQVTVRRLARHLEGAHTAPAPTEAVRAGAQDTRIAVIGMALKVPGADDLDSFWNMVARGGTGIERFTPADEGLVGARSQLNGLFDFDPEYFGISRREAQLMDPQQRHLLMGCVHALQHAGIDAARTDRRIGVVASCGEVTYFQDLLRRTGADALPDSFQMALHHDKDFLATKVAFHLDLKGPALSVQAACGSSLIAVHMASAMLRQGDSDLMLAGGVLVDPLLTDGYRYRPQHIFSRDGDCRPFSDDASGTIGASGYGVVVLKPLAAAERDGDRVYAVIEGSAINNDGTAKLGYTAPSLAGQGEVIRAALHRAGLGGADVGYVEAHGTGTQLGDPVEVAALAKAFGPGAPGSCALSSVKSQIGHLGAAAGVAGMVRAALALFHGVVPPNIGFRALNPQIALDGTPFYIPTEARPWPAGRRRVAGISSFGIGGTNAHLVLAQAPERLVPREEAVATPCLLLSARSESALRADIAAIAAYLDAHPGRFDEVLRHLQAARPQQRWRFAAVCRTAGEAVAALRDATVREAEPRETVVAAKGASADAIAKAWLDGAGVSWREAASAAPWDFPPAAFDLAPYHFDAAQPDGKRRDEGSSFPARQPAAQWLYQSQWLRQRRLPDRAEGGARDTLVLLTAGGDGAALLDAARSVYQRVIQVDAGNGYRRIGNDRFEVDPCDPQSLGALLSAVEADGATSLDWLHALPLSVAGEVGEASLARAQWACVDSVAALMQAWGQGASAAPLRLWLLSHQHAPVEGPVLRPELGALAGGHAVVPQEYAVECRWLDLPSPSWAQQAGPVAALLASPPAAGARLAIRDGYLWQSVFAGCAAQDVQADPALLPEDAVVLVIGGGGGIGAVLARQLLAALRRRVVLLSRRPQLPALLREHAGRVDLVAGDIGDPQDWPALVERLRQHHPRLDGIVHAAGLGLGSLIQSRGARRPSGADPAKTLGMAAVETLVAQFAPRFVLYCSSMSAVLGGAGQFDYAAANGVLDGFAHYRPAASSDCVRMAVNWDIWREAGMAVNADLAHDARHQAHLAVGLSNDEGARVFDQALRLQLPQLLVSTTQIEASRRFYPTLPRRAEAAQAIVPPPDRALAAHLRERMGAWLGVSEVDTAASLYDLGADSLTLLDLIGELAQRFQVTLQLSQFGPDVSLDDVVALAEAARRPAPLDDDVPIELWREGSGADLLCLVHPVGGDVQAYRELVAALDADLRVCVIADPLLADPDLPPPGVHERAARYLRALERRFPREQFRWQLAGWSFGAAVACAMGALAEEQGAPVAQLHLIDPPPPASAVPLPAMSDAQLEAVFRRELLAQRRPDGTGVNDTAGSQDYARRLAQCCKRNMASLAQFQPARLARTAVHVFVATRPDADALVVPLSPATARTAWRALLPNMVGWHPLDADHYGIMKGASARLMAETISRNTAPVFA
ncbi:MAG: amino acid adenylation domain-containing protein [Pseudomonadota bacterium]